MHSPHNHPDIKIGEIYNLRIHVVGKSEDFIIARPITQNGGYATCSFLEILHKYAPSFTPIPSEHGTSSSRRSSVGAETEVPKPKYDPCRPFKAGDVARVVERFGRIDATHTLGALVTVTKDEREFTFVHIKHETGAEGLIPWLYLELVTPVEELGPYTVDECGFAPTLYVRKNGKVYMTIPYKEGSILFQTREEALAAAEAECARLNAEHRKEQSNG